MQLERLRVSELPELTGQDQGHSAPPKRPRTIDTVIQPCRVAPDASETPDS
jgi:hypothetical protein